MADEFELDRKLNKAYWRAAGLSDWVKRFWTIKNAASAEPSLDIDGEIGFSPWDDSITAKDFISDLKGIAGAEWINLSINSPGGSVFDGFKIFNALIAHESKIRVRVDPVAASIASVIAMAGDEINMPENALMMIHDPMAGVMGTADDMRSMAGALDRVTDGIMSAYGRRVTLDKDAVRDMMHKETWISGSEAVEWGFADHVESAVDMAACWGFDWSHVHAPKAVLRPKEVNRSRYKQQFTDLQVSRLTLRHQLRHQ